jgi:hypothetical protein
MIADATVVELLPIVTGLNECVGKTAASAMVDAAKSMATSPGQLVELLRSTLDDIRARQTRPTLATTPQATPSLAPVADEDSDDDEGNDDGADTAAAEPESPTVPDVAPETKPAQPLRDLNDERLLVPAKFRAVWHKLLRRANKYPDRVVVMSLGRLAKAAKTSTAGARSATRYLEALGALVVVVAPAVKRAPDGKTRTTLGQYKVPPLRALDRRALIERVRALSPDLHLADPTHAARQRRYRARHPRGTGESS